MRDCKKFCLPSKYKPKEGDIKVNLSCGYVAYIKSEDLKNLDNKNLDNKNLDNIIESDDTLYKVNQDGSVFPISHPDLSTQPSLLPQKFGAYKMYEVVSRVDYPTGFDEKPNYYIKTNQIIYDDAFYEEVAMRGFGTVEGSSNTIIFITYGQDDNAKTLVPNSIVINKNSSALSFGLISEGFAAMTYIDQYTIDYLSFDVNIGNVISLYNNTNNFEFDIAGLKDVPNNAFVTSAIAFDETHCQPIKVMKFRGKWVIGELLNFRPEFIQCQYYMESDGYYYDKSGGGKQKEPIGYVSLAFPIKDNGKINEQAPMTSLSIRVQNPDTNYPIELLSESGDARLKAEKREEFVLIDGYNYTVVRFFEIESGLYINYENSTIGDWYSAGLLTSWNGWLHGNQIDFKEI